MILKTITSSSGISTPELPYVESGLYVNFDGDVEFDIDVQHNFEEIFPSQLNSQRVSLLLHVEGFGYIYPRDIVTFNYYRDIEEGSRMNVTFRGDAPKILTELNWRTAPPGMRKIQVWTGYQTSSGLLWKKMMTDGVSDSSSRNIRSTGATMSIDVLDKKHRYKCAKINYHVPPNSNKYVAEIIKEIAEACGVTEISIPQSWGMGWKTNKAVTINCEEGWPKMEEYAEQIGAKVNFSESGVLQLYDVSDYNAASFNHVISDMNIVDDGNFNIEFAGGDVYSRIIVRGEKTADLNCGRVTYRISKKLEGPRLVTYPVWTQSNSDGSLSLYGVPNELKDKDVISEVINILEYHCNTLLFEMTITKGWKRRETWRYHQDVTGAIDDYNGCFIMDTGATLDDGSKAYFDAKEKYVILSKIARRYFYSNSAYYSYDVANGYQHLPPASHSMPYGYTNLNEIPDSVLYRTIGSTEQYAYPKAAVKNSAEDFLAVYLTGDKQGIANGAATEKFYGNLQIEGPAYVNIYSVEDHAVDNTLDGFVIRERSYVLSHKIQPGSDYIYSGDQFGSQPEEYDVVNAPTLDPFVQADSGEAHTAGVEAYYPQPSLWEIDHPGFANSNLISYDTTTYTAKSGKLFTAISSTDFTDISAPTTIESTIEDGHLPASTFRDTNEISPEATTFFITAYSDLLDAVRGGCANEIYTDIIDTEEWAEWYGYYKLREGSALDVTVTTPMANFILPDDKVRLICKFAGCRETFLCTVNNLSKTGQDDPILSKISGKIYVI